MSKKFLLLAAGSLLVVSPAMARDGKPTFAPWGVDLSAMDSAVKPGDNFFQYVNGAWAKRTEAKFAHEPNPDWYSRHREAA